MPLFTKHPIKRKIEFLNEKGERAPFNYSSEADLNIAKQFYHDLDYVGSGHITFIDDAMYEYEKLQHFFKLRDDSFKPMSDEEIEADRKRANK